MKNALLLAALLGGLMNAAPLAIAEPFALGNADTLESLLSAQQGKKVTIRLGSGEELSGTVKAVNGSLVQLSELSGKEFYDAIIAIPRIVAVIVRAKP
ncbi:MAG: hypothetical protein WAW42_01850 [Candidatus Competibacteraceae bacterium]